MTIPGHSNSVRVSPEDIVHGDSDRMPQVALAQAPLRILGCECGALGNGGYGCLHLHCPVFSWQPHHLRTIRNVHWWSPNEKYGGKCAVTYTVEPIISLRDSSRGTERHRPGRFRVCQSIFTAMSPAMGDIPTHSTLQIQTNQYLSVDTYISQPHKIGTLWYSN